MNISFRQLRLVLALAETGSVSGAARMMHVTQPTASMQLKDVANAIGLPIYEVVGRRVYMTEIGKELASTARAVAAEWDSFEQRADARRVKRLDIKEIDTRHHIGLGCSQGKSRRPEAGRGNYHCHRPQFGIGVGRFVKWVGSDG